MLDGASSSTSLFCPSMKEARPRQLSSAAARQKPREGMSRGVTVLVLKASGTGRSSKGWVVLAGQPWKHLASAWQMGSRGRTSFWGPDLVLDTPPWPCWQLTWPRPPLTAVPTCPVICMTNSNLFYRKPSHWGCEGELWLVWAGACAAPVLSWGSVAINTSAGCWSSRGRAQPQSGIMSWHHLPSHPAAASKRQPCTPGGCCQTLPTCLP